jgi:hypothetical protein
MIGMGLTGSGRGANAGGGRGQVLHSALVGMLANGPLLHLFFEVMERLICFRSELCNVLCKIVVDQVVWGCMWNASYIFLMNLATDSPGFGYIGEGLGTDAPHDLAKGFASAFAKGFLDWRMHAELLSQGLKMLPMDIICYWIIPLRMRALWVLAWPAVPPCHLCWVPCPVVRELQKEERGRGVGAQRERGGGTEQDSALTDSPDGVGVSRLRSAMWPGSQSSASMTETLNERPPPTGWSRDPCKRRALTAPVLPRRGGAFPLVPGARGKG